AQLRVLAVDIVNAGMRAHTEPSLRPPVRAHRPDEAADVLLRRRAVDLTRLNGAPAVQRIARGVQHVLEARAAIDVGSHTGNAGVVAARQAQTLTGVAGVDGEVEALGQIDIDVRACSDATQTVRPLLLRPERDVAGQ